MPILEAEGLLVHEVQELRVFHRADEEGCGAEERRGRGDEQATMEAADVAVLAVDVACGGEDSMQLQLVGGFCSAGSMGLTQRPLDLAVGICTPAPPVGSVAQALICWSDSSAWWLEQRRHGRRVFYNMPKSARCSAA